ncbi:transformer-2 sex-determining protein-like isoform X1 [Drosophila grimshawi]|uniref:transformer-2 sex-determining protein-like isoform X1 n=1 Tax=Drosophila grimshawi TaxID=7222 RepID=UPI000C870BF3|nr:transformer-2 sex-determining protein-like isoform X1 [Drosophila grimshawi]
MTSGFANARKYLHLQRSNTQKFSRSSASPYSPATESSDSARSRQRRSDVEVYSSRHPKSKSGFSQRRRSFSGSESPPARRHNSNRRLSRDYRMRQVRSQDNPQASRCIGVFGLHTKTTQLKVRELFNKFGPIERIQMVIDAHTHRSRGFCFIYYENIGDARVAKDACTGMDVDGRRIRVDYSITQRPHTPTPGVYMGRPSRESRSRRRNRRDSSSVSPNESKRRNYRSRQRYDRSCSRSRSYSRSRSPRKPSRYSSHY